MAAIRDLGRRIELVSMDPHFHDISIGLYERPDAAGVPEFLVHSYSGRDGAAARIAAVAAAMRVLGGMEASATAPERIRFACGSGHRLACRRVFLEACKLPPEAELAKRPLGIHDNKADCEIEAVGDGAGQYRVGAENNDEAVFRRVAVVAGGLVRLAEMLPVGDTRDRVAFACGHGHDALVGLLLPRALNVRTAMREIEAAAARGVLMAPSAQT